MEFISSGWQPYKCLAAVVLPAAVCDVQLAFYAMHNIGWVAHLPHNPAGSSYMHAGRFKKASNMNYTLAPSQGADQSAAWDGVEQQKRSPCGS